METEMKLLYPNFDVVHLFFSNTCSDSEFPVALFAFANSNISTDFCLKHSQRLGRLKMCLALLFYLQSIVLIKKIYYPWKMINPYSGVLLQVKAFVYYYQFGYIYQLAFQYSNHALQVPKHVVFPGYQIFLT